MSLLRRSEHWSALIQTACVAVQFVLPALALTCRVSNYQATSFPHGSHITVVFVSWLKLYSSITINEICILDACTHSTPCRREREKKKTPSPLPWEYMWVADPQQKPNLLQLWWQQDDEKHKQRIASQDIMFRGAKLGGKKLCIHIWTESKVGKEGQRRGQDRSPSHLWSGKYLKLLNVVKWKVGTQ